MARRVRSLAQPASIARSLPTAGQSACAELARGRRGPSQASTVGFGWLLSFYGWDFGLDFGLASTWFRLGFGWMLVGFWLDFGFGLILVWFDLALV